MPLMGLAYVIYTKILTHVGLIHLYSLVPWWRPSPDLDESTWVVVAPAKSQTRSSIHHNDVITLLSPGE